MAPSNPWTGWPDAHGGREVGARAFTEFRNKTEFSDLSIAGISTKSEVFQLATRQLRMAPPLLKRYWNRISGGVNRDKPQGSCEIMARCRQRNRINEGQQYEVPQVFGLLAID
jgi:hypothetical protein